MKILDGLAKKLGFTRVQKPTGMRGYNAATNNRLTYDWLSPQTSADAELRNSVVNLRSKAREGERNDDYLRRYLSLLENNVLGAKGICLQMKVMNPDDSLDTGANWAIEDAWYRWGEKKNCSVTKQLTWRALQRIVLRSAKRDGGALVRFIRGYDNDFKYALQLFEIDQLDDSFNAILQNGGQIRMGVEFDSWGAPVAYHLLTYHPGDTQFQRSPKARIRVPVSDLLHIFLPDRIGQSVGASATAATLMRLKMLSGYEEAELTAARAAACKGGGIKQATPEGYQGTPDGRGNQLQAMEAGMQLLLNPGEEYFDIDPKHPMDAFPSFIKSILRAVAGGLGVSYNSLANDLEGVNYSSLRAGLLDEREEWKVIQQWFIEELCEPVFEDWLEWSELSFGMVTLKNGSPLPASKFDKFHAAEWKPRRWPWVDPVKDMEANIRAVEKGFDSRRRIISEEGRDIEDVFLEQSEDKLLADQYGLEFPIEGVTTSPGQEGDAPTASDTVQAKSG